MKILTLRRLKNFFKIVFISLFFINSANAFFTDVTLPKVQGLKTAIDRSSIGLEWKSLANYPNVQGINIYRAVAKKGKQQIYTRIDSIGNRFATHYVDTTAKAGVKYFYTLTTVAGFNESGHGDIVAVKTKPPYKEVKFVSATLVDRGVVKLLWVPHSEKTVTEYLIQRQCKENRWHYLKTVKGRLYPEYVDTKAPRGFKCNYRVFARDSVGLTSYVSKVLSVEVR